MSNVYHISQLVRISATFTVGGAATDPTTVTLRIKDPSGNKTVYTYALAEITKDSAGVFHKDITVDEAGCWYYRWEGTGTVQAVDEDYFYVRSRQVGT